MAWSHCVLRHDVRHPLNAGSLCYIEGTDVEYPPLCCECTNVCWRFHQETAVDSVRYTLAYWRASFV